MSQYIDWETHLNYLMDNKDNYDTLKEYLDKLYNKIESNKTYDRERHCDDERISQDVDDLVEEWFTHHTHEYDSKEQRDVWMKKLVWMIKYKKDEKRYEIVDGKREYMGPYIGADAFYETTGSLYCDILRKYYGLIGCTWYNG